MTYLYVKNGCPGCVKAREFLTERNEEYKEVAVDNPVVEVGIATVLKKGHVIVPLLVRTNGRMAETFVPAAQADGSFFFVKAL